MERCACGRPLHYTHVVAQEYVQAEIDRLGPTVAVQGPSGTWVLPRHFCVLHTVTAAMLPRLARRHGWKRAA